MANIDNQHRIVVFLRRHGESSLTELSRGLGLTQVTIRRHLDRLMRDGIVSPPEKRHRRGPGRPEQAYSLTGKAESLVPGDYRDLAHAVLGVLEVRHGTEWLRKLLLAAGARAASGFDLQSDRNQEAFLAQVLSGLELRGYMPAAGTWSGRRCLTFAQCPYLDAARGSPVVCAFDQALLENLLGEPVILFRRIAEHDQQCIFLLGA